MAQQRDGPSALPGLLAMLLAISAIVWYQQAPLESARPPHGAPPGKPDEQQKVEARLWQDPLEVVRQHLARPSGDGSGRTTFDVSLPADGLSGKSPRLLQGSWQPERRNPIGVTAAEHTERLRGLFAGLTAPQRLGIVAVMLPGAPYAEAAETRRRIRYAVVSALLAEQREPEDAESLRYVAYEPPPQGPVKPRAELIVPYERFVAGSRRDSVVLLWLDDRWFAQDPLEKLHRLATDLRGALPADVEAQIKVLGPTGSQMLYDIVTALAPAQVVASTNGAVDSLRPVHAPAWCAPGKVPTFELISPFATSETYVAAPLEPDARFTAGGALNAYAAMRSRAAQALRQCNIALKRAIGTDLQLAALIGAELERRGVRVARDRIAVVAEADTTYARAFPAQMQRANCSPQASSQGKCRIDYFSYLRGLDGRTAGDAAQEAPRASDKRADKEASKGGAASGERADGNSQQDYLRRLAAHIKALDEESMRQGRGELRAIGVMGSDIYDKLLVLRALREAFPKALFFTTDLDARMLQSSEIEWTRNLLVASSFGLELRNELQVHVPPFRDNYQTAAFFATRLAVGSHADPWSTRSESLLATPRMFEIGHSRAFDLTAYDADERLPCTSVDDCASLHPVATRYTPDPLKSSLLLLAGFLLLWRLTYSYSASVRAATRDARDIAPGAVAALAIAVIAGVIMYVVLLAASAALQTPSLRAQPAAVRIGGLLLAGALAAALLSAAFVRLHGAFSGSARFRRVGVGAAWLGIAAAAVAWIVAGLNDGYEPWTWSDGISIWPSVAIRLLAVVLTIYFILRIRRIVAENEALIASRFGLSAPDGLRLPFPGWRALFRNRRPEHILVRTWVPDRDDAVPDAADRTVIIADRWKEFVVRGAWWARCYRCAPLTIVGLGVGWLLVAWLGGPGVPYRGFASLFVYSLVIFVGVVLFLYLIFIVVDVIKLAQRMIDQLNDGVSQWPDSTQQKFQEQLHLDAPTRNDWIDLRWIAEHTAAIDTVIYYPAIILVLFIFARHRAIDNFDINPALVVIFVISGLTAVACAVMVRRSAEHARHVAASRISRRLIAAKGDGAATASAQLQEVLDRVEKLRDGAFAPYAQQPMLKALLLPLGGIGGAALVDYLTLFGI